MAEPEKKRPIAGRAGQHTATDAYYSTLKQIKLLNAERATASSYRPRLPSFNSAKKPETIDEKIRKQKIENDNTENDQKLKKNTLVALFIFLGIETAVIFTLAFFQGFKAWGFELDVWSFRILVIATLGQITAMLTIAVRHLFPHNKSGTQNN